MNNTCDLTYDRCVTTVWHLYAGNVDFHSVGYQKWLAAGGHCNHLNRKNIHRAMTWHDTAYRHMFTNWQAARLAEIAYSFSFQLLFYFHSDHYFLSFYSFWSKAHVPKFITFYLFNIDNNIFHFSFSHFSTIQNSFSPQVFAVHYTYTGKLPGSFPVQIITSAKEVMFLPIFVCLFVCLSVC